MPEYLKKPVIVEAMQWDGTILSSDSLAMFYLRKRDWPSPRYVKAEDTGVRFGRFLPVFSILLPDGTRLELLVNEWLIWECGAFRKATPEQFAEHYATIEERAVS